jgi:hypothetical protein
MSKYEQLAILFVGKRGLTDIDIYVPKYTSHTRLSPL